LGIKQLEVSFLLGAREAGEFALNGILVVLFVLVEADEWLLG
jgi:hypothetical protein